MTNEPHEGEPRVEPVDAGGEHVAAEIPGTSGHHPPGTRSRLVDQALDAEPVKKARHVTVVAPLGDVEALERIRERLHPRQVRAAGASVVVDADKPSEPPADAPAGSEAGVED